MRIRLIFLIKLIILEIKAIFGTFIVPGTLIIFLTNFFFILRSNTIGLTPFVFTPSRHLVFTLSLSLPLWLGSILWSCMFQFNRIMAHLVPLGTPGVLMPAIVFIETVRSLISPITLAIRLTANIIAGHLLLTLLGGQGMPEASAVMAVLIIVLVLLLMLECAVACIQSYVFTILGSLYLNELSSLSFTKKSC